MPAAITVLLTTRDRPALLVDALASIAAQTFAPAEIRVADTGEIPVLGLEPAGRIPVCVLPAPGLSAARARNLAAREAATEALAFLDDDDRWLPTHLEGLARAFESAAVRFAYRDAAVIRERVDAAGERHDLARREIARDWDDALMRTDDYLPPSAWAMRRSLFDELGGFDPAFRFSDDWDLLLRAARLARVTRVPGVTAEIRMREGGNASADFGPERLADLRRLEARHGLPPLVPKTFWEVAEKVAAS